MKDTATRSEKVIIERLKDIRAEEITYYSITEIVERIIILCFCLARLLINGRSDGIVKE